MRVGSGTSLFVPGAVFFLLLLPLRHGFTDDGFIHIQYARNIMERGEYGFNPGEVSYGTTSPLWVMVLAALGRVFGGGENLVLFSRVLSWLCGATAVFIMFLFGRSVGLRASTAWLGSLTLAAHAWHLRWTALSMETSSAVLLIAAVGVASVRAHGGRQAGVFGCLLALASLLRPEAYLLLPVYLVSVLFGRSERRLSNVLRTLAVYAALVVPWLLFARVHLGQFLPNTAAAKSGGLDLNPLLLLKRLEPLAQIMGTDAFLLAALATSVVVLRSRARVLGAPCRFLLLWVVALPAAYVVLDMQVLSRYMLLVVPFSTVLGFLALEDLANRFSTSTLRRTAVLAPALAGLALNVAVYLGVVVAPSRAFSYDLTHRLKDLALYLKDHSDEDAVVAAVDIGYLAFYSQRRVLDLGGLVDTGTRELSAGHTYEEIVHDGLYLDLAAYPRVDFFVDRELVPNRFHGATLRGYRFEGIRVERVENLGIRKPGPYFYTLYRLDRDA